MRQNEFKAYIESIKDKITIQRVYWATRKVKLESGFIVNFKRVKEIVDSLPKEKRKSKKKIQEPIPMTAKDVVIEEIHECNSEDIEEEA